MTTTGDMIYSSSGSTPARLGLGTGMQLGALAPQMGMAGANYGAMATSPYATSAYMNPYLSASLAPQLEEARRQYDITGLQQQSQAARAGAFGGSREAIMAAENRRNMAQQMNQMIGQGYNQAFNPTQYLTEFVTNTRFGTPTIDACSQGVLPASGMTINVPSRVLARTG